MDVAYGRVVGVVEDDRVVGFVKTLEEFAGYECLDGWIQSGIAVSPEMTLRGDSGLLGHHELQEPPQQVAIEQGEAGAGIGFKA